MSSTPRLTHMQAVAVDNEAAQHATTPDLVAVFDCARRSARILDLLDQLRDTTARAEQAEKDRDALAAKGGA